MQTEVWKTIENYPEYQVSNLGHVKSLNYHKEHREALVKPFDQGRGYLKVCLHNKSGYKYYYVHRLVAEAFIDNPDNLPCVNHKDEDRANNVADNLEWCTVLYNNCYGNHRYNNRPCRSVKCIETNTVYRSATEASRAVNKHDTAVASSIARNCLCAGYHWEYCVP